MKIEKCVLILDGQLPSGLLANTAVILGVTLGRRVPEIVGCDVAGRDGHLHPGIVELPIPVLQGDANRIRAIREQAYNCAGVLAAGFSQLAQSCRTYEEFQRKMEQTPEAELNYLGLVLCGSKKQIDKLTGNLPLLRCVQEPVNQKLSPPISGGENQPLR